MTEKKKKTTKKKEFLYSKNESFENLEAVQQMALNRKGKDDEISPDISIFLKAEELKGKMCGLYEPEIQQQVNINCMGSIKIGGKTLNLKVGKEPLED